MKTSLAVLAGSARSPTRTRFLGLDPLVATVMKWGHSLDDEQWAQALPGQMGGLPPSRSGL